MDAKITKERLANFLSYDWLKIVIAIAFAVCALCVFFTTVQTRPRADQEYELYGYTGISWGSDSENFEEGLRGGGLSYDILTITFETFDSFDTYSSAAYAARRAAGEGKAMFVSGESYTVKDSAGNDVEKNYLDDFLASCLLDENTEREEIKTLIPFRTLFGDCEDYLASVFGENWRENALPDDAAVRSVFLARNGKDKRFRTSAEREKGIALERERLLNLREDYLAVKAAVDDPEGPYSYVSYTSPYGKTYEVALNIGGLKRLSDFVFCYGQNSDGTRYRTSENMRFVVFYNQSIANSDLRFESVSLLASLLKEYGE